MTTRTTVRMRSDLMRELKQVAAREGVTITHLIEEAVREALAHRRARGPRPTPARLPVAGRGGVWPGVDLDAASSLLGGGDERHASA